MSAGSKTSGVGEELIDALIASYHSDEQLQRIDCTFLPSRDRTIEVIELLRRLVFPGYFDDQPVAAEYLREHVRYLTGQVHQKLYEQVCQALKCDCDPESGINEKYEDRDGQADQITLALLEALPEIRAKLGRDVRATYDGDPASVSTGETIFCYPGIDAIFVHRVAHQLHQLGVPLLPRIMSEYSHNETGIDIHPGATIGESFCIDHGTGVVVGETCEIGDRVTLYQGVTLGALSLKGGHERWRGRKRHPTIEDDVTIYGGAIILGGETVIGRGATIGGAVFITSSIPAEHMVTMDRHNLKITPPKKRKP